MLTYIYILVYVYTYIYACNFATFRMPLQAEFSTRKAIEATSLGGPDLGDIKPMIEGSFVLELEMSS